MAYDDRTKSIPSASLGGGLGEAVECIAGLAAKAAGEISTYDIHFPAEHQPAGLPEAFPILIKDGVNPTLVDLKAEAEKWRTAPARRSGTATATTLASFIALVERHKDQDSILFAKTDWPNPHLLAVFDYHEQAGAPRFGQHRAKYAFPVTKEFEAWITLDKTAFSQFEFAQFVEERIADLSVATEAEAEQYETLFRSKFAVPTDLLELARGLQVHVGSRVKNAIRLQTGEAELVFETVHADSNGEPLHVPGLFMLRLPAFIDGQLVSIVGRLRYRVKEGAITWSYELYQWEEILRRRVVTDFATAATQTGLLAIEGAPEA